MFGKKYIEITYLAKKDEKLRIYIADPKPVKTSKAHNTYKVHRREGTTVYRTLLKNRIQKTRRVKTPQG